MAGRLGSWGFSRIQINGFLGTDFKTTPTFTESCQNNARPSVRTSVRPGPSVHPWLFRNIDCAISYILSFLLLHKWTHWDLNPGPSACEADVIPLHHAPVQT